MTFRKHAPKSSPHMGSPHGYTLIELMLIVAIISIILVMALPLYQQYSTRARIAEGLSLATPFKTAVAETYLGKGTFPTSNAEAGIAEPGGFETNDVDNITVSDTPTPGAVIVTFKSSEFSDLSGNMTLILVPSAAHSGSFMWECNQGTLPNWARPKHCR